VDAGTGRPLEQGRSQVKWLTVNESETSAVR
jgi:hypothetical protein